MLTQQRYQAILKILNERNAVTVSQLTELLNTSESTIRRDLTALDEMGKLNKVFGGATSIKHNSGAIEDSVSQREEVMIDEKTPSPFTVPKQLTILTLYILTQAQQLQN